VSLTLHVMRIPNDNMDYKWEVVSKYKNVKKKKKPTRARYASDAFRAPNRRTPSLKMVSAC